MEKPIAAIELGSKKLKLVVGYEIDGQVYVLYTLTKPYGNCIEGGNFVDANKVAETIGSIREFTDPSAKLRLNISDVLLCLPPYGLGIYQTRQVTTVVTEDSKISNLDIKNIYALIRNSAYPLNDKALVDVVPESFSEAFRKIFIQEYSKEETRHGYWEDVYIRHLAELPMKARKYRAGVINEFDSIDELRLFDCSYIHDTRSSIVKKICSALSCKEEEVHSFRRIKHDGDYLLFSFRKSGDQYVYDGRDSSIKKI